MVADGIMGFVGDLEIVELARGKRRGDHPSAGGGSITTFFSANLLKLLEGAWVPLLFGVAIGGDDLGPGRRGSVMLTEKTRRTESSAG